MKTRFVSAEQLAKIYERPAKVFVDLVEHLNSALYEFEINTPRRIAAFLAQVGHESGRFRYLEEIADGSAYEGREDLGNKKPGDGKKYKGRGVIQLTGFANYFAAGRDLDLDLVNNPRRAADPDVAFMIAGWFWKSRDLNLLADLASVTNEGLAVFRKVTSRINGGQNGAADREALYARAWVVLGAA
jgi:putative chitinase